MRVEPYNTRARGTSRRSILLNSLRNIEAEDHGRRSTEEAVPTNRAKEEATVPEEDHSQEETQSQRSTEEGVPPTRRPTEERAPIPRGPTEEEEEANFSPQPQADIVESDTDSDVTIPLELPEEERQAPEGIVDEESLSEDEEVSEFGDREYDMPDDQIEDEEDSDEAVQNRRPRYRIRSGRRIVRTPSPPRMCFYDVDDFPEMLVNEPLPIINSHDDYHEGRERRVFEFYRETLFTWMRFRFTDRRWRRAYLIFEEQHLREQEEAEEAVFRLDRRERRRMRERQNQQEENPHHF